MAGTLSREFSVPTYFSIFLAEFKVLLLPKYNKDKTLLIKYLFSEIEKLQRHLTTRFRDAAKE